MHAFDQLSTSPTGCASIEVRSLIQDVAIVPGQAITPKPAGTELLRFARFAGALGHQRPLTQALQLEWAQKHVRRTAVVTAARRLEIVRPFAAYSRQSEVDTEVPAVGILGRGHRRLTPHIYTDEEVRQLLELAGRLTTRGGRRPLRYCTLFGLIAVAGLRVSEGPKLQLADVDLHGATITVRQTKSHKSRCLPPHVIVVQALTEYGRARDRCANLGGSAQFFVSHTGSALPVGTVRQVFGRMRARLKWHARGDHTNPRIQDLRHVRGSASSTLARNEGVHRSRHLLAVHLPWPRQDLRHTYGYLTGVPELMDIVGAKFESFALQGVRDG